MKKKLKVIKNILTLPLSTLLSIRKPKIFCIGLNKTGTTSLKKAVKDLGIIVGNQRVAEKIEGWDTRDFRKIVWYCRTAQFFQDLPFSRPFTFIVLDYVFSGSKFILTIRNDADQWYNSLIKFHSKIWAEEGRIPTKLDLENAEYVYKGWAWKQNRMIYSTPENDPYNKEALLNYYNSHISFVLEYFRHRPKDLLVLNVSEKDSYFRLCEFLGKTPLFRYISLGK